MRWKQTFFKEWLTVKTIKKHMNIWHCTKNFKKILNKLKLSTHYQWGLNTIFQNTPWQSSTGACSGCGGAWSGWGRVCSELKGPMASLFSPLRRDSSSSSSRILLFSLTQLGQKEVEGSSLLWLSSSVSSTFRSRELTLPSDKLKPSWGPDLLLPLRRQDWDLDLLESSREASRTSLKMRSIFFLLAGGWLSDSSLGSLLE